MKEQTRYCPGDSCDSKKVEEIRKTTYTQMLVLVGFFIYIFVTVILFGDDFSRKPEALFKTASSVKTE